MGARRHAAGFTLRFVAQLTDELVILPKIFRRLAEYLTDATDAAIDLSGFSVFLSSHGDDKLFTVPARLRPPTSPLS